MPIFTISFELRNQSQKHDYQPLLNALKEQKCHALMQNQWLGNFDNNATQVHTYFKGLLDKGDRLMVAELQQHYAYSNSMPRCNDWLKLNPPAIYHGPADLGAKKSAKVSPANPDKPAPANRKKSRV